MTNEEVKNKLDEFRGRLSIDSNHLEDECIYQAVLYGEVGEFAAELRRDAKIAKERLDYEKAGLQRDARMNPANYGITKVTEAAIEEAVLTNNVYRKVLAESIDSSYLADCANILQTAIEHRKSMVKDLVTLFVHEYYSSSQDMTPEKKFLTKVTEEEIMAYRRRNATLRSLENEQEESLEGIQ